jgi:hypothetical protein
MKLSSSQSQHDVVFETDSIYEDVSADEEQN